MRLVFIVLAFALALAGCESYAFGRFVVHPKASDNVVTPSLREAIGSGKRAVVVRNATGGGRTTAEEDISAVVNQLEMTLLQQGFTVRDRSLLETVLNESGGKFDYEAIAARVQTDFIIEIQEYEATYEDAGWKSDTSGTVTPAMGYQSTVAAQCAVARVAARVTVVAGGQLGGILNVASTPCAGDGTKGHRFESSSGHVYGYGLPGQSYQLETLHVGDKDEATKAAMLDLVAKLLAS